MRSYETVRCSLCGRVRRVHGTRIRQLERDTDYPGAASDAPPRTISAGDFVCAIHSTHAELDELRRLRQASQ